MTEHIEYKTGDTLPNGAIVLEVCGSLDDWPRIALCLWAGEPSCPWVTWHIDPKGNAYWGHYFRRLDHALTNFRERNSEGRSLDLTKPEKVTHCGYDGRVSLPGGRTR